MFHRETLLHDKEGRVVGALRTEQDGADLSLRLEDPAGNIVKVGVNERDVQNLITHLTVVATTDKPGRLSS